MRILLLFLALFLSILPQSVAAQPTNIARIKVEIVAEGLRADFRLSTATKRFEFGRGDIARDGTIEVLTPKLAYGDSTITADKPFRQFSVLIKHSELNFDGKYAPLRQLGAGRVLYGYTLHGAPDQWRTTMRFKLPRGYINTSARDTAPVGFVYIGPSTYVQDRGTFALIAAPDLPASVVAELTTSFDTAIANYTQKLAQTLPNKPIVMAQLSSGLRGFQGSVSNGFATHLRFGHLDWDQPDAARSNGLNSFVAHEVFHFWNGGVVGSGGEAAWLHEGGAEYAAILTAFDKSSTNRDALNAEISSNLNRCRGGLKRKGYPSLDSLPFLDQSIRYPCGVVMMWASDLHVRRASAGARSFFDVWRDLIALGLTRPKRTYKIADFITLIAPQSGHQIDAIRLLREGSGSDRFTALVAALRADGAQIEEAPTTDTMRAAVVIHALRQACQLVVGKTRGFSMSAGILTLDTHEGCGVLAGSPVIKSIQDADVSAMNANDFARIKRQCDAKLPLSFTFADGRTELLPCQAPLPDPELEFSVKT